MTNKRSPIRAETIQAVAAEYAGQPIDKQRADAYLGYLEPICEMFSGLRNLPIKDIEPGVIFRPVVRDDP
jgi:hypothetical protein